MRLNELTRPSLLNALEKLQDAGYELLGSGMYGDVVAKHDSSYVLKLFDSIDQAYLKFVKLAKENNNPHFPKFTGKLIKVTPEYYAIRMEPLVHKNTGDELELMIWYLKEKSKQPHVPDESFEESPVSLTRDYWNKFEKLTQKMPRLQEALDLIATDLIFFGGFLIDLHDENVMFRKDGTLVLSDPVS